MICFPVKKVALYLTVFAGCFFEGETSLPSHGIGSGSHWEEKEEHRFLPANPGLLKKIEHYEIEIMCCIMVAGVITGLLLRRRSQKRISQKASLVLSEQKSELFNNLQRV